MTQIALSWNQWASNLTITSVSLQRATAIAPATPAWSTDIYPATSPASFTDTGLRENTLYTYQLRATNGAGNGPYTSLAITSANAAPAAPTSPTTSAVTSSSMTLSWTRSTSDPTAATLTGNRTTASNMATLNTSAAHGWIVGQSVTVAGVTDTWYNGTFTIASVPTTTSFTYAVVHANAGPTAGTTGTAIVTDMHATQPYEVFQNGVSQGFTTAASFSFTGLTENTAYTMGVRAKDTGLLTSSIVTASPATTGNANPGAPTSPNITNLVYNGMRLNWTAPSPYPADFANYEVFKNGVSQGTTTNLYYDFTGLTQSTSYTMGVRTVDTGTLTSSTVTAGATTPVNPDTTPPPDVTYTSFQPESSYGNMVFRFTTPTNGAAPNDYNHTVVERSTNGATWTTDSSGYTGSATAYAVTLGGGPYTAGTTVYVRATTYDTAGNFTVGTVRSYTLIASPSYFYAVATNVWRNTNGGEYNNFGDYRPMQGYFSNAAWIARGMWYYDQTASGPQGLWLDNGSGGNRRTVPSTSNGRIWVSRSNNTGTSGAQSCGFWMHDQATSPGTVTGRAAPNFYGGPVTGPALGFNAGAWMNLPDGWANNMVSGSHLGTPLYGIGCYVSTQNPYLSMTNLSQDASSGLLEINHYG